MKNFDRMPAWARFKDDFDFSSEDIKIKPTASKEAIQSFLREEADFVEDKTILTNAEELSNYMIEEFKKTDCFKFKSEEERKEVIQYLIDNPDVEEPIYDDNGNLINILK